MAWVAVLCLAAAVHASPNRVAALGGEGRFLVDPVNVHEYPALAVSLGHAGLELFDEWAGAVVPVSRGSVGLYANRPSPHLIRYNAWLDTAGAGALARLDVRPWIDAVAGLRLGGNMALGIGLSYAADLEDHGSGEVSATATQLTLGTRLGPPDRRLDLAARLRRHRLRDGTGSLVRRQSDGDLLGLEARGRWLVGESLVAVPVLSVESGSLGLEPGTRDLRRASLGVAAQVRPSSAALALVGVLVEYDGVEEHRAGSPALEQWTATLPALVGGAEVRVGSLAIRAGLRHEVVRRRVETLAADGQVEVVRTFDAGLRSDVGLGLEFGDLRVDGVLEKDFLRDGPHFLGGSRRGGGIFANLSLEYRLRR